jgi:hypothetical protein
MDNRENRQPEEVINPFKEPDSWTCDGIFVAPAPRGRNNYFFRGFWPGFGGSGNLPGAGLQQRIPRTHSRFEPMNPKARKCLIIRT